ncbi:hypothetical protein LXL04_035599 [Taraxacum kok-saghyz]
MAGMPVGTKKEEIKRCFEGFGELVDVFMGRKKHKSGQKFAFVKFNNIGDARTLQDEMLGLVCCGKALSVNVAKYGCNKAPIPIPVLEKTALPNAF